MTVPIASDGGQLAHLLNAVPAIHLHADLDDTSRATEGVSHAPGVARVEGHRFFLVHVLACLDGGDEVNRVQVLRRRDQDRVDRLVVEERPVVFERRNAGDDRLDFIKAAGVDVGDGGRLDIGTFDRGPQDLLPARTAADQTEPDSLVRPSDSAWSVGRGRSHRNPGRIPRSSTPRIPVDWTWLDSSKNRVDRVFPDETAHWSSGRAQMTLCDSTRTESPPSSEESASSSPLVDRPGGDRHMDLVMARHRGIGAGGLGDGDDLVEEDRAREVEQPVVERLGHAGEVEVPLEDLAELQAAELLAAARDQPVEVVGTSGRSARRRTARGRGGRCGSSSRAVGR